MCGIDTNACHGQPIWLTRIISPCNFHGVRARRAGGRSAGRADSAESISMVRTKNQSSSSSASSSSTKSPIKSSSGAGSSGGGLGGRQSTHRSSSASNVAAVVAGGSSAAGGGSSSNRRSPGSSPDGDDDTTTTDDLTPTTCSPRSGHHHSYGGYSSSVHKQNLYVVSFPIIFLFNVLRSLIYQLFCIFRYLYGASTKVIYRPHRRDCNIEIVVQNSSKEQQQSLNHPSELNREGDGQEQQLSNQPQRFRPIQPLEMATNRPGGGYSPGPGDPLLAKQKHHHRRAFEYISKALKIDEENEGEFRRRGWQLHFEFECSNAQ